MNKIQDWNLGKSLVENLEAIFQKKKTFWNLKFFTCNVSCSNSSRLRFFFLDRLQRKFAKVVKISQIFSVNWFSWISNLCNWSFALQGELGVNGLMAYQDGFGYVSILPLGSHHVGLKLVIYTRARLLLILKTNLRHFVYLHIRKVLYSTATLFLNVLNYFL